MAQVEQDRELAAKFKARVALAALRGDRTIAELAVQFGLDSALIEQWKLELENSAEGLFLTRPRDPAVQAPLSAAQAASPGEDPPTLPEWPSGPKPAPTPSVDAAPRSLDDDFWDAEAEADAGTPGGDEIGTSAIAPPGVGASPGLPRKLLGPLFVEWKERHHATKASRELLKLYERFASLQPKLKKQDLYRQVVRTRIGGTEAEAVEILTRATESFATWPVERPLTFRDVVHYLAVTDYLASTGHAEAWTRENLGRVVASLVPDNL